MLPSLAGVLSVAASELLLPGSVLYRLPASASSLRASYGLVQREEPLLAQLADAAVEAAVAVYKMVGWKINI